MSPLAFIPLTITPVSFSLTDGTDIPAPQDFPQRPPTPGGGPLSSHPTTPNQMPGAFPVSPSADPVKEKGEIPLSPPSPSGPRKRPNSVRKLLSFRSLRHEREKHGQYGTPGSPVGSNGKSSTDSRSPVSPSFSSRPGSPYTISSVMSSTSSKPSFSRNRNSVWFGSRRKSGFFPLNIDRVDEGVVMEGGAVQPPESRGPAPPTLPEFREFKSSGEALNGGHFGAEEIFRDIN